ncbi:MAG: delta-60 repeat domain-containing protein [Xanthomonadales bacterium]|nr:delta-60 repeat domain-containing protein [Xanthomonadales bacterium]
MNADGSVDRTFAIQGSGSGDVYTLARQADGKTVVGGNFTSINGHARNRLARLYGAYVETYVHQGRSCGITPIGTVQCWGANESG